MNVKKLQISNYRNIEKMTILPHSGINVIFGENAQGKTNLLESIWLFSGFRSFRGSKENDLIKFGEDSLKLDIDFFGNKREQNAKIMISRQQKKVILNSVPLNAASKFIGNFNCVVFSPSYLSLVRGGPSERRKFIDSAICQIKPNFTKVLTEYNKILNQRNSLVKELKYDKKNYEFLDIWNQKLASDSFKIEGERLNYLNNLVNSVEGIYGGLSGKREKINLSYEMRISSNKYKTISEQPKESEILEILKDSENSDIYFGTTNTGAHRDEIDIKINGVSAKYFGSQGQQRSAALALKLGEAEILKEYTGERPVALLDDVMSELDVHRQDYILNHIKDWQVFITCCEPSTVLRMCNGKTFNIENGKIAE